MLPDVQLDDKLRLLLHLAAYFNRPAVHPGNFLRYRKAKAGSERGARWVYTVETVEDIRQVLKRIA